MLLCIHLFLRDLLSHLPPSTNRNKGAGSVDRQSMTLTNMHWELFSFDSHRYCVKENKGTRATLNSVGSSDKCLHDYFTYIPYLSQPLILVPSPVSTCLKWVSFILPGLCGVSSVLVPRCPPPLLLIIHGAVQTHLCAFLLHQCCLWLLFSALWLSVVKRSWRPQADKGGRGTRKPLEGSYRNMKFMLWDLRPQGTEPGKIILIINIIAAGVYEVLNMYQ